MNCFEEIRLRFRLSSCSKPCSKSCSKQCSINSVPNHVRKIKKIANENMSFLKITDHKKRNFIVNEFLKTRQNSQQNFLSERVGDVNTQYKLSKLFKPVTDMQKDLMKAG